MDNICHTLVGAAIAQAGLRSRTRFASAALMVSANLPDLDVLVFATNTPSVEFRRGWTHGIAAQLVLPIVFTGLLWLVGRASRKDDGPPIHAGWLLALSYIGVYSHVFLDYLNNYGVRLLAPVDWRWFYGDAVFIVDPWLWLALGLGVWLARRWSSPWPARHALAAASVYVAAMLVAAIATHRFVEVRWTERHGFAPQAVMVGPRFATPFSRDIIVDAGTHYERGTFTWPSSIEMRAERIPKNDTRPEAGYAKSNEGVRAFLVWSRFPFWTLEPAGNGTRVTVADARFMAGGRLFSASTVVATPEGPDER